MDGRGGKNRGGDGRRDAESRAAVACLRQKIPSIRYTDMRGGSGGDKNRTTVPPRVRSYFRVPGRPVYDSIGCALFA